LENINMAYYLGRDVSVTIAAGDDIGVTSSALDFDGTATTDFCNKLNAGLAVSDLTGVDLGVGVTDEDISAFGLRTVGKIEIKKETTLSLTRKKGDNSWDLVFNSARHGVEGASGFFGYGSVGHVNPGRADYGYRVFLKLKDQGEVMTLPNCCITGHAVTLNADGTSEETMEFMCYVEPMITSGATGTDPVSDTTVF
jgi:hypothetical protein